MATKEIELEKANNGQGCLGKAGSDEPVFILRAKDKLAPDLVEEWAKRVEHGHVMVNKSTHLHPATKAKLKEARALAHQMRAWQELNTCKLPD